MNNRHSDPMVFGRQFVVQPGSIILFDVEVRLEGSPRILPESGHELRTLLMEDPIGGRLSEVTHSQLTGCELTQSTLIANTFHIGFVAIGGVGKGAGHSVSDATIRRGFQRALEEAFARRVRRLVGVVGPKVSVRDVVRLPLSSSMSRMERMVKAGINVQELADDPTGFIIPPDGSRELLDKTAQRLTRLLAYDERRDLAVCPR